MKVLLDTCVWGGAKETLEAAGYDVIWGGDWPSGTIITADGQRLRIRPPD